MEIKQTLRPSPTAILNPRLDPNFKAIFTQETEGSYIALQSFLSSVLCRKIKNVSLTTNEPPVDTPAQMQMSFDVSVIFEDGERACIEMQGRNEDYNFETRSEIQVARLLNNNVKKGAQWQSEKVYQIAVLNFHFPKDDNREMTWYNMRDKEGHVLSGHLNVIYIDLLEIKKLTGRPVNELTALQKWGLYLSYADDESKSDLISQIKQSEKGIMEADLIIGKMSEEDANWFRQNSIDIARRDRNTALYNAEQRGLKQGEKKQAIADARSFYENGATIELIAKSLKMTLEEVREIVKDVVPEKNKL